MCASGAGPLPFSKLTATSILRWRDSKADRPEAANSLIKALRQLFAFAIEYRLATKNPAKDVRYLKGNSEGFHSWSEEEIGRFEAHHQAGSTARLALALLLHTGQRRSDVVLFGRQHVRGDWLHFTQQKNRNSKPVTLTIPLHPELRRIIDATPSGGLTFLMSELDRPFTANGFGNRFRKWCDEAGLPSECSAHGLRKAAASRLAEAGATELEIRAITGHQTSREVSRYTKAALGSDAFSAQYQQVPTPPGGAMIKRNWIKRYGELPPQHERFLILQSWDTANKGGPENDFSVCTTWFVTRDRRWYLLDVWRRRVDYPDLKAAVQTLADRHKARRVLVEDAGAGTSLVQELRGVVAVIVAVNPVSVKISRMAVVSAKFESGLVFFPERAPWLADFEAELFAFPGGKHDDQCDSVSQALTEENCRFPMVISAEVLAASRRPRPWMRRDGGPYGRVG